MRNLLLCSMLIISAVTFKACKSSAKEVTDFYVIHGKDTTHLQVDTGGVISGFFPDGVTFRMLQFNLTTSGNHVLFLGQDTVWVNLSDTAIKYGLFTTPMKFRVYAEDSSSKDYVVKLYSANKLPVVSLNVSQPIVSKEDYVAGTVSLFGNYAYPDSATYYMQIRGRGNSTWGQPKIPFKIKLVDKNVVYGMPADKEYALLANYFDKSLMRIDVAFELGERLQMTWTPKRRFVDVYVNSSYLGNYLLTETVKTSTTRLNITPMSAKKGKDTTGDYLLEVDFRRDGIQWFNTTEGHPFVLQDPDSASAVQLAAIKNNIQHIETLINTYQYKELENFVDKESWVKWTIVNELMRNRDAILLSSVYFYKYSSKLYMGPVWDFDMSSGNYEGSVSEGWYVNESNWYGSMFRYDTSYRRQYKEIWNQYKEQLKTIPAYIENNAALLQKSASANYAVWDVLANPTFPGQIYSNSYSGEVALLKTWYQKRFDWMDAQINGPNFLTAYPY